jgi:hypothetical protein
LFCLLIVWRLLCAVRVACPAPPLEASETFRNCEPASRALSIASQYFTTRKFVHLDWRSSLLLPSQTSAADANGTWTRHIVRLTAYEPQHAAHARIRASLSDSKHESPQECLPWLVLARDNAASRYPTDFAVVSIAPEATAAVTAALASQPFVRDVHIDRVLRVPLSAGSHGRAPSGPAHGAVADDATVSKGRGRLRTRWSLDDTAQSVHDDRAAGTLLRRDAEHLQDRFVAHAAATARRGGAATATPARPARCRAEALAAAGVDVSPGGTCSRVGRDLAAWGPLLWGAGSDSGAAADGDDDAAWVAEAASRRRLHSSKQVTTALGAPELWKEGYKGRNVRVGARTPGQPCGHSSAWRSVPSQQEAIDLQQA